MERVLLFSVKIINGTKKKKKKRNRKATESLHFGLCHHNWQVEGQVGKYLLRIKEDLLNRDLSGFPMRLSMPWWSDYENNVLSEPGASRGIAQLYRTSWRNKSGVFGVPQPGDIWSQSCLLACLSISLPMVAFYCQKTRKQHREILWLKGISLEMFGKSYDFSPHPKNK